MEEQLQLAREAKLMKPIYRMVKIVEQEDSLKAKTLMAVTVQYITDHYVGKVLTPTDVQQILRVVLLREEDGKYFVKYLLNELQVKVAGWLTLLSIDRPVTLGDLGKIADDFALRLSGEDSLALTAEQVIDLLEQIVVEVDETVYQRLLLNHEHYLQELRTILG